jgi:hypothetical protein
VPGYIAKLLFPNSRRSERRRKLRAVLFWLITCLLIAGGFAYLLLKVNAQGRPGP